MAQRHNPNTPFLIIQQVTKAVQVTKTTAAVYGFFVSGRSRALRNGGPVSMGIGDGSEHSLYEELEIKSDLLEMRGTSSANIDGIRNCL